MRRATTAILPALHAAFCVVALVAAGWIAFGGSDGTVDLRDRAVSVNASTGYAPEPPTQAEVQAALAGSPLAGTTLAAMLAPDASNAGHAAAADTPTAAPAARQATIR